MSSDSTTEETNIQPSDSTEDQTSETIDASSTVEVDVQNEDANETAESSTANDEDAKEPESLFDAVTAAIDQDKAEGNSSNPEEKNEDTEVSEVDDTSEDPPFHEHPRWQEMISERDSFKKSADELTNLKGYISQAGLSTDEVNTGFEIMRLMKQDPHKALQTLIPYVDKLEQITGARFSEDIQQKVDDGYMDEDSAREMSELRSRNAMSQRAAQNATAQAQQLQNQTQINQHADNVSNAVSQWEGNWKSSDPDYKLKQPKVMEKIELNLLRNGAPRTIEEAVELAEQCRKDVDQELSSFRQPKGAIKPVTGGSSPRATPEPSTLLEAMQQGLAATGS